MNLHRSVAHGRRTPCQRQSKPSRDLVDRAEKLAVSDADEPFPISALCLALAVSERTLRKAFHKVHGMPPCRHLRLLRLAQARAALLSADGKLTTVTAIATCFGFQELGRFSVEYRKTFGESPSQTLSHLSQTGGFQSLMLSDHHAGAGMP
jgi:transcriptional regulator GlxA family with amidase domain